MGQRTEKEETELKVPETIALCSDCGLAGSSSANNMCQKCFNDTTTATSAASSSSTGISASHCTPSEIGRRSKSPRRQGRFRSPSDASSISRLSRKESSGRVSNRCSGCRKRVGLTGIRCRCGDLFCFEHRYSDRHDCSYDYKAVGREAIARENPVVKAAKIIKV